MPTDMQFIDTMHSRSGIVTLVPMIVFSIMTSYGEFFSETMNSDCSPYMGCYDGFSGYDALEHFLFGFAAVWVIVWLCERFPHYSILSTDYRKSALILVSLVALAAVGWEIVEFLHDVFLFDITSEPSLTLKIHVNLLAQPNNIDTMGDLTLSLLGSLLTLPLWHRRQKQ